MPRLDGIETARRLRSEGLGPVVLLTAYSEEKLVQKAGESGVYGYLLKPVREIDLRVTLQLALANSVTKKIKRQKIKKTLAFLRQVSYYYICS